MEGTRGDERPRIEHGPTRCPYCHASVEEAELEASVVCERCLARHHRDCWSGSCASCSSPRQLVSVRARDAAEAAPAGERDRYETAKAWINRAWLASFLLCMLALPVAAVVDGVTGAVRDPPGPPMFAMAFVFLCALVTFPMFLVNFYDAAVRTSRDARAGPLPVIVAGLGLCSGGFSSFGYYLRWGWQPLPPVRADTARGARPDPKASPED